MAYGISSMLGKIPKMPGTEMPEMSESSLELVKDRDTNPEYTAYRQSERWEKLRRAASLRANGKCEICLRKDGRELAHLTYERIFNERLTDVLWVCVPCHRSLDGREHAD